MSKFYFENKGPINILKESEAQNLSNETCVNCVVELNKESIVKEPDSLNFKLIVHNQRLVDENVSQFYNYNKSIDYEIFQIDCKTVGLSLIKMKSYLDQPHNLTFIFVYLLLYIMMPLNFVYSIE